MGCINIWLISIHHSVTEAPHSLLIFSSFIQSNLSISAAIPSVSSPLLSSLLSSASVFLGQVRGEYSWSSIDQNVLISDWGRVGKTGVQSSWLREEKFDFTGDDVRGRKKKKWAEWHFLNERNSNYIFQICHQNKQIRNLTYHTVIL